MSGDTWGDGYTGDGPVETLGDAPSPTQTMGPAPAKTTDPEPSTAPGAVTVTGGSPTRSDDYGSFFDPLGSWVGSEPSVGVHGEPLLKPTIVNLDDLDSATRWLAYCKQRVELLIRNLKEIPGLVGDPVQNGDLPDGAKPADQPAGAPLPPRTGPPGTLLAPGPTKFGLFPNAITLANTHVSTYNNMLAQLTDLSKNLTKALEGTAYIAKKYKSADDAANADIARIMIDPPYVPRSTA